MLRTKGTAAQLADTVLPFPLLAGRTSLSLSPACMGSYKGRWRKVEGISLGSVGSREKPPAHSPSLLLRLPRPAVLLAFLWHPPWHS